MKCWNIMYGYVEYANSKGVTTFKHSKPQMLLLATDMFLLSTVTPFIMPVPNWKS